MAKPANRRTPIHLVREERPSPRTPSGRMLLPRPVLSAAGARCGTSKLGLTSGLTVPSSPLYQGRTYAPHATRRATASIHTGRAAHDSPDARGYGRSAGDDSEPRRQGLRGITCADVATRGS